MEENSNHAHHTTVQDRSGRTPQLLPQFETSVAFHITAAFCLKIENSILTFFIEEKQFSLDRVSKKPYRFLPFICLKDSTWAPQEQTKTVQQTFLFLRRYSRKTALKLVSTKSTTLCQRSQQLGEHRVSVVNDYADTVAAQSTTTWTRVSVVDNYADTWEIILLWKN